MLFPAGLARSIGLIGLGPGPGHPCAAHYPVQCTETPRSRGLRPALRHVTSHPGASLQGALYETQRAAHPT